MHICIMEKICCCVSLTSEDQKFFSSWCLSTLCQPFCLAPQDNATNRQKKDLSIDKCDQVVIQSRTSKLYYITTHSGPKNLSLSFVDELSTTLIIFFVFFYQRKTQRLGCRPYALAMGLTLCHIKHTQKTSKTPLNTFQNILKPENKHLSN